MSELFENMSVIELRQKAKEMGVKLGAGINKQGIIDKLKEASAQAAGNAPETPEAPQNPDNQQTEMFSRPIRSAAIITDDEEADEDTPIMTPSPASRLTQRPAPAPTGAAAPAGSSLSSISSKAPAFTMEGSRAWHNPRAYQTQTAYQRPQNNSSWNKPQQAAQEQRSYTRPDPRMQQRPQQPAYVNRFGPDQGQQDSEPQYRGYNAPVQQDYAGREGNPAGGYGYSQQPGYTQHRDAPISNSGLSDLLAAGDCGDGEGVLELHPDGYGFLRSSHYLSGRQDVYISNAQIRRFSLRTGDYIVGKTRPQRENDRYGAMLFITEINGMVPDESPNRPRFEDMTPIYPKKRIALTNKRETDPVLRLMEYLCPIGFGQRALLSCSGRVNRLELLKKLTAVITRNYSKAHVMMVLLDERPEEITELQEAVRADMAYANFDEPAENQARVAELAIERAMRLTEQKKDVVILCDSLTKLGLAGNAISPASARSLNGGLAAGALNKAKRFFGAARNTREGGSLTIIATMISDSTNELEASIQQGFQGTSNMRCVLEYGADRRLVLQPQGCATIHNEWLLSDLEQAVAEQLREMAKDLTPAEAMNAYLPLLEKADSTEALAALLNSPAEEEK